MKAGQASSFVDEFMKIAADGRLGAAVELAGLGTLAAPQIDKIIATRRARKDGMTGELGEHELDKYRVIKSKYDAPIDVAGLGILAAPYLKPLITGK